MRRHATQHGGIAVVTHVYVHCGYTRGHAERLSDVNGLFGIVTALRSEAVDGASIRGNAYDLGGPFLLGVLVVGIHVGYVKSQELQQPDVLALAGESGSLVVSRPHVAAAKGGSRTGAGCGRGLHASKVYARVRDAGSNSCPGP